MICQHNSIRSGKRTRPLRDFCYSYCVIRDVSVLPFLKPTFRSLCTAVHCFSGTVSLSRRCCYTLQSIDLFAAGMLMTDALKHTRTKHNPFFDGMVVSSPLSSSPPSGRGQGLRLQQVARRCCGPWRGNQGQYTGTKQGMHGYSI